MNTKRILAATAAGALAASVLLVAQPAAVAEEAAPTVGDCLVIEKGTLFDFYGETTSVPCAKTHQSEVYEVIAYPEDEGAPSTIGDRAWELFGTQCTYMSREAYLGTGSWKLPVRVYGAFRLPSDEQWETGARWVLCTTYRPNAKFEPMSYKRDLPTLLADSPGLDFLSCLNGTPKTGRWNDDVPCTKKAKWIVIAGVGFKGKPSKAYPKDVQKKADGLCAKNSKGLLVKGAKTPPRAGLGPKSDMLDGEIYADCYVPFKEWNGKVR